ncbi:MAG: hypothetical protein JWM98_2956 [Thermoleophilia bacterium]|nr:hypothetical protein [Thermoleophilia bacterium]
MTRHTRMTATLVASLAVLAIAVPGAQAKGGGTSAPAPAPAPAPVQPAPAPAPAADPIDYCADPVFLALPNPEEVLINYAGSVGCAAVRIHNGVFSLAAIVLAPGWSYSAKSSTTGGDRVKLDLTNGADQITYLVEPGKTWIR